MDLEQELTFTNSELRFIALELMKLAEKRGIPFKTIAKEYIENVTLMQRLIDSMSDSAQAPNLPETHSD